jgi:hypothetical protein
VYHFEQGLVRLCKGAKALFYEGSRRIKAIRLCIFELA